MPDPNQEIVDHLPRRRNNVYGAIRTMGTASIRMIARYMEVDKSSVTGRLDELRQMGIVDLSHKDVDVVTGITVHFWKTKARRGEVASWHI